MVFVLCEFWLTLTIGAPNCMICGGSSPLDQSCRIKPSTQSSLLASFADVSSVLIRLTTDYTGVRKRQISITTCRTA